MDGVVKDVPDPNEAPPVAAAYQFTVPLDTDALKSTVPVPQFAPSVTEDTEGLAVTVAFAETAERRFLVS